MKPYINIFILVLGVAIKTKAQQIKDSTIVNTPIFKSGSYYIESGAYGSKRESDPPNYVRDLSKTGIKGTSNVNWLDVGLDYRVRFESRTNDLRRPESYNQDYPFLLRSRAYLGIKNKIDPFRAVLEFEDANRVNGKYPLDDRDVNRAEIIQGYVELHFKSLLGKDGLGNSRPVLIRAGRMAFEFLNRNLIGLNQWRNTTNNFTGLRASLGQDNNDWQLDLLALRPVQRIIQKFDRTEKYRDFWAAIGHWRKWSKVITIEPYYLGLQQRADISNGNRYRIIHSPGVRLYGWVADKHVNYDVTATYQFGKDNNQIQNAYAATAEIGYTVKEVKRKPRFSVFYAYVTGDKSPSDNQSNRFERFFGFARPWSSDDYIIPENIITTKGRVELELFKGVKYDGGYSFYWLQSATDRFSNFLSGSAFNRDVTGKSGTFIGHGLDSRIRFKPISFIDANIGYTHHTHGEFVKNRQKAANGTNASASDFYYIELSFNFFDLTKYISASTEN